MNIKRITAFAAAFVLSLGVLATVPEEAEDYDGAVVVASADDEDFYEPVPVVVESDSSDDDLPEICHIDGFQGYCIYDSKLDGWFLTVSGDKQGYNPIDTLDIPEKINGKKVVGIDSYCFDPYQIKHINIPDTVTYISIEAISGAPVQKGFSVTYKEKTYDYNERMKLYIAVNSWKHTKSGFYYKYDKKAGGIVIGAYDGGKKNVKIPSKIGGKNVTAIGSTAFNGCDGIIDNGNITSVYIPNSVKTISLNYAAFDGAFNGCINLTKVHLPNSIDEIGDYTFSSCSSLKSINIPEKVKSIGKWCFEKSGLVKIIIPDNVKNIGDGAFSGCDELEDVKFGSGLKKIGAMAFQNCKKLKKITIPDNVTEIGAAAFRDCNSLEEVQIGKGIKTLRGETFAGCTNLKEITIPTNVTKIERNVFRSCENIVITYKGKKYNYEEWAKLDENRPWSF